MLLYEDIDASTAIKYEITLHEFLPPLRDRIGVDIGNGPIRMSRKEGLGEN